MTTARRAAWWSRRRRCVSMAKLERWRRAQRIPEVPARAFVSHLTSGCGSCWAALEGLAPLEQPGDGIPLLDPELEPSLDAVVRALRTVGGWPPRRWLRPRHRMALDGVPKSMGWLALVVEESFRVVREDAGEGPMRQLLAWLYFGERLAQEMTDETSLSREELAWTMVRAYGGLAEIHQGRGDRGSAEMSLDWAERLVPRHPTPGGVEALLATVRARITEPRRPELACALYELAVEKVGSGIKPSSNLLGVRIETLLELAAFHLRQSALRPAERALGRIGRLLDSTDEPLARHRLDVLRSQLAIEKAERITDPPSSAPLDQTGVGGEASTGNLFPALLRLGHQVVAFGWARWLEPIPAFVDPRPIRDRTVLQEHLTEILASLTPMVLRQRLRRLAEKVALDGGHLHPDSHPHPDLGLRILLTAAKVLRASKGQREIDAESMLRDLDRAPGSQRRVLDQGLASARLGLQASLAQHGQGHALEPLVHACLAVLDRLLDPERESQDDVGAADEKIPEPQGVA